MCANAGGYDSGNDNMIIQEDTIFVSGMSSQTTEEDIACHFGAIGIIKVSPLWMFYMYFFYFYFSIDIVHRKIRRQ